MTGQPEISGDEALLSQLRAAWSAADPVPRDLAERSLFAVQLEGLDAELARLMEDSLAGAGARAEETARTLTFSSSELTATITISDSPSGGSRLDGWLAPAEPLRIEIRRTGLPASDVYADDGGRFVIDGLGEGLVQLVFHPATGEAPALTKPVAAPPVRL